MQVIARSLWVLTAFLAGIAAASAQEHEASARDGAGASYPFFQARHVDFWRDGAAPGRDRPEVPSKAPVESIWAEPIRLPDGRVTVYVPPAPVLRFMENPTRASGEKYVAWQEERMGKLKAAIEILRILQVEREEKRGVAPAPPGRATGLEAAPRPFPSPAAEILYFKKEGCPWCREEDKVLAALAKENANVTVKTITPAESPELWKEYGVDAVPALVVRTPSGRSLLFRGFTPAPKILDALKEVSREKQ